MPLSDDGRSPENPRVQSLLQNNIRAVAVQINCPYDSGGAEEAVSHFEKIRDTISAFDDNTLPEDFRPDLVDDSDQHRSPEECAVQGDLQATVFRLALHDDNVYTALLGAMPPPASAILYFDKILAKAQRLLRDFDRYSQTGQYPADGSNVEPDHVTRILQRYISRVHTNVIARAPYGIPQAARSLVSLLADISNRNQDALEGNQWNRQSFHGENADDRNLYHMLIDRETEFPILDALELLSGAELQPLVSDLRDILERNQVFFAPRAFLERLETLIRAAHNGSPDFPLRRQDAASPGSSGRSQ